MCDTRVSPPPLPTLPAVRARLARAALGLTPHPADAQVGRLTLHPHQRHAVARLRYALHHYRTALLADDVGLGKTLVALALLRDTPDALVVAPAALRAHWVAALSSAGLTHTILSTEALGRGPPAAALTDQAVSLLVIDEAHHFRNPRTARWRRVAALATSARVVLLSATPVHNRPDDLAALFALALGGRARALDAPTLARLVVRRAAADLHALPHATVADRAPSPNAHDARPAVAPTTWLDVDDAPDLLDAIRTLPPAAALRDGTAAPDLDRYTLIRLWTSSDAALRAALRRRRTRALALRDALGAGLTPSRAEFRTLTRGVAADPTTYQLALLAPATADDSATTAADRDAATRLLDRYVAAVGDALARADATDRDSRRLAGLRTLRARHPEARIVAFSWSADTVRAHYRALAPDGRVAMLTATGGRIASGPLARADVLARFAPLGQARAAPPAIERITLLITTDALSEGLDLRDASVVVHLDLPWTPARLAQRTGRAVRPGSPASVVHVYAFRPPPAAAAELRLASHARAKRAAARRTVGVSALEDATTLDADAEHRSPAAAHLSRDRLLERWSDPLPRHEAAHGRARATAAVRCGHTGYLAVVARPTALGDLPIPTLVAAIGADPPSSAPRAVRRALACLAAATAPVDPPPTLVRDARRQLARWARRRAARDALVPSTSVVCNSRQRGRSDVQTALLARAARTVQNARPTDRAALAIAAAALRDMLARPLAAHREIALQHAQHSVANDAEWLTGTARDAPDACPHGEERPAARPTLRALVLFVP